MPAAFVVIRPSYTGQTRRDLPRLAAGVADWVRRLKDHGISVEELPTSSVRNVLDGLETIPGEGRPVVVYVGGHGLVEAREHYTALDSSPARINSWNALWTRQL